MAGESSIDPFLLELVKRTNQHKLAGFFVTLLFPGGFVSGRLISRGHYLRARQIALNAVYVDRMRASHVVLPIVPIEALRFLVH